MKANKPERLLVIALDAAEVSLVERWMADGTLPNLSHLVERGTFTRLASTADWLVGTPWPTFYTGVWPVEHGFYNYLQWRPELMKHQRPSGDWLPLRPFWRDLGRFDRRVIALDVPLTYPPEPFDGVEISGWASHDKLWPPAAHPKSVLNWINREFGPPPLSPEIAGLQGPSQLLKLRDQLIQATLRVSKLARTLMHREAWDLFIIGFAATHRGGHKLWDQTGVYGAAPWPTPGRNPDGRSGHHRSEGFLVAAGEGILPTTRIEPAHILDLAPTLCDLLGVPKAPGMRGQPISLIRSGLGVRDSTLQSAP
jgi:predicted AlkP superfamily phosphohydrolase/phosphomutase